MQSLRPVRILVVTATRGVSENLAGRLRELLEDSECLAADLEAGLEFLATRAPDILFCDKSFLDRNRLLQNGRLRDVPVIVLEVESVASPVQMEWPVVSAIDAGDLRPRLLEKAVRHALHGKQVRHESLLRDYESIVNRSPAVVFLWRVAEGFPVEFVTENVSQFGYSTSEFLSGLVTWHQLTHPDDRSRLDAETARHLRERTPAFFAEYRLVARDGGIHWVEDRTMALFDNQGAITHYQGIIVDTTERRQTQDALNRSKNIYETLVLTAPDAVMTLDSEAHILFASPRAAEMARVQDADELVGLDSMEFVVAEFKERARAAFQTAIAKGSVRDVHLLLRRRDGAPWHVEFSATAFRDAGGQATFTAIARDISERVAAEEALKRTQDQLRSILDNSRDVAYKLNVLDKSFEYVSPSVSMFGLTPEEVMEQGQVAYHARMHPEDAAMIERLYERHYQDPEQNPLPPVIEYRIHDDAGAYRWFADTFRAVLDTEGRFVAEVGTIRDITEQKTAERLMLAQRDFALKLAAATNLEEAVSLCLEMAMDLAEMESGGLYLFDRARGGYYLTRIANLPADQMMDLAYFTVNSPPGRLLARKAPVYCRYDDFPLPRSGMSRREKLRGLAIIPILHQSQVVGCLNVVSRTREEVPLSNRRALETIAAQIGTTLARLQVEEALRESEEKYRNLVENAYDGICIVQEGALKYLNRQLAQMLGWNMAEMLNTRISERIADPSVLALLEKAAGLPSGSADPPALFEAGLTGRDGRRVEVEIKASPITFKDAPAALVLVRDVTERNRSQHEIAKQKLEIVSASRMSALGMMASGVAHEINNPLAVISGVAEQLRSLLQEDDRSAIAEHVDLAMRQVDTIIRHAHRIERVIMNMKAFSRDGAADPLKRCRLSAVIADALDLCEARFAAHDVVLDVAPIPHEVTIECRPAQISQVLVNLLSNAFDAVEKLPERWVRVDFAGSPDAIELGVTDSGPGMEPIVREQALRPFFTTKEIGKGSGLGLTISKGIVENHRGTLEIDGDHPHTRLVVRLPRVQPSTPGDKP